MEGLRDGVEAKVRVAAARDEGVRDTAGSRSLGTAALQLSQGDRGKGEGSCQASLLPAGKSCVLRGSLKARPGN